MSQELNLEEGRGRQFSREVSRKFRTSINEIKRIRSIGELLKLRSCYQSTAEGLIHVKKAALDPGRPIGYWIFLISYVITTSADPLYFYVPVIDPEERCLGFDRKLRISAIVLYAFFGFFYVIYFSFLLRTSLTKKEARPTFLSLSMIDFLVLIPIPLVLVTLVSEIPKMGVDVFLFPMSLYLFQYLLRVIRISISFSEATKTSGILAGAKWTKAAFNLLLYLQGGHVFGGLWYFFAVHREITYFREACEADTGYVNGSGSFYCDGIDYKFRNVSCTTRDSTNFDFGIFDDAIQSRIVETTYFLTRLSYCLRWGVQTLSCLGQNLRASTFILENFFVICISVYAVVVLVFFIGNMQTYLQSETIRSGEVRLQGRKTEQWMSFWKLSENLQLEVRKFQPYLCKDPEAKIVHAENLLKKLPRDLQKNIKCELCLELLKKVEEFGRLSELALEDLCGCLQPVSFNERARIIEEGDPVDEMLFIVQGKLRTYTSMDIRTGSPTITGNNRKTILLKDGDICGKELVTWVLADPYSSTLPVSTTTIRVVTKVEAFAITVEHLQDVFAKLRAVHFIQLFWRFKRALHSRKGRR